MKEFSKYYFLNVIQQNLIQGNIRVREYKMSHILTKLRTHQITKLINEGFSKSEMAKQLGITVTSVTYWCKKLGIEPPKK